jgi:DNA (cytosine-5)-methyltransferase 1
MNALSLFANVGFGEVYLNEVGINVIVANELLKDRAEFYSELHPNTNMICGDITKERVRNQIIDACPDSLFHPDEGINLIIATPPCQGMSKANAMKKEGDSRNDLICHAMDLFNDLLPDYMLIENVPDLVRTYISIDKTPIKITEYIESRLPEDYKLKYKILDAKFYNTPQSRKRFIGLISKGGKWEHPESSDKLISVKQAIGNLPSLESGERSLFPWHYAKKHNKNHILWMENTPTGQTAFNNKIYFPKKDGRRIKGFHTTYKRIRWSTPSPTITMTNGSISSQNNVHPGDKRIDGTYTDARVLSVMEVAILCGLAPDYLDRFSNTKYKESFLRKVLGECFPPTMSKEIFKTIPLK